jgi:hypothetical protein
MGTKKDVWQGTLTDDPEDARADGPQHGYGIARASSKRAVINYSSITARSTPPCSSSTGRRRVEWGVSDNNRRAKAHRLTRAGKKHGAGGPSVGRDDGDSRAIPIA